MTLSEFLQKIRTTPKSITLEESINVIGNLYDFVPVSFLNGGVRYEVGQNVRSCQILAFGIMNHLTVEETLSLFGSYYQQDVLGNPTRHDHLPIRNFIMHGWDGVEFDDMPLTLKATRTRP
jgi:hypothetical protein